MKPQVILGLASLALALIVLRRRNKPKTAMQKIQHRAEDAIEGLEHRVSELRNDARRFSGEAKQRLQDQAHELEAQQHDLKRRLNEVSGEAHKLLEKARSKTPARAT